MLGVIVYTERITETLLTDVRFLGSLSRALVCGLLLILCLWLFSHYDLISLMIRSINLLCCKDNRLMCIFISLKLC